MRVISDWRPRGSYPRGWWFVLLAALALAVGAAFSGCMTSEQATRFDRAERDLRVAHEKLEQLEQRGSATKEEAAKIRRDLENVATDVDESRPVTPPWLADTICGLGSLALLYFTGRTGHRIIRKKRGSPKP